MDYFSDFYGVLVDMKILDTLISQKCPQLAEHFAKIEFNTELLTFSWIVNIFVNKIPLETVLLVFDLFFLKGVQVLLRVALSVFQILQEDCLKFDRFDLVLVHIQEFIMGKLEPAFLLANLSDEIPRKEYTQLRELF